MIEIEVWRFQFDVEQVNASGQVKRGRRCEVRAELEEVGDVLGGKCLGRGGILDGADELVVAVDFEEREDFAHVRQGFDLACLESFVV